MQFGRTLVVHLSLVFASAALGVGCIPSFPGSSADGGPESDATMPADGGVEDADADAGLDARADAPPSSDAEAGCASLTSVHSCGACTNDCAQLNNVAPTGLACAGNRCTYECASGYADCGDAGAGCATNLASSGNCGACGIACSGSTPVCARGDAGTYACSGTCTTPDTNCGGTCANLMTDPTHCGACATACASAQTCAAGVCKCPTTTSPDLCGGACTSLQSDGANCGSCGHGCTGGQTCQSGACACPAPQTLCGTTCVDASTDSAHCGASCTACSGGTTCQAGQCLCPTGTTLCGGTCVNLTTDVGNCGACGSACSALSHVSSTGLACSGGHCSYQCAAGFDDCGKTGTGCATPLSTSTNCGACAAPCSGATPTCQASGQTYACSTGCPSGQANCSGTCATLASDSSNCGACGKGCLAAQSCASSICQCPSGTPSVCGTTCVNEQTDNGNCGACAAACPTAESCQSGHCACPTTINPDFCSPSCTNLKTDNTHCGSCTTKCPSAETCQGGVCACPTTGNPTLCGTTCTNTNTDGSNCGKCGAVCATGETCQNGTCACPTTGKPNYCGSACTSVQSDNSNCGACGTVCSGGEQCLNGVCQCPSGSPNLCGSTCTNVLNDTNNCGACGKGCAPGTCSNGTCQPWVVAQSSNVASNIASMSTDGTNVVWMDTGLNEILQTAATGTGTTTVLGTLPAGVGAPYLISLSDGVVAWSSFDTGTSSNTFYSGPVGQKGTLRFSLNPSQALSAVAVDTTGKTLYYVATSPSAAYQLYACTLATGVCSGPFGVSESYGTIVMNGTYLFWGDINGKLNRMTLSTGAVSTVTPTLLQGVSGIALDATNVYWASPGGGLGTSAGVMAMPQAGGTMRLLWSEACCTFANGASSPPENSLTTDGKNLFFDVSNFIQYISISGSASPTNLVPAAPNTAVAYPQFANGALYYVDGPAIYGIRTP